MNRTLVFLIIVFAGALVIAIAILFAGRQATITIRHDLMNTDVVHQIGRVLQDYADTNQITIDFDRIDPDAGRSADVRILHHFPNDIAAYVEPPTAWSGQLWALGVHSSALGLLEQDQPQLAQGLLQGTLDIDAFETVLHVLHGHGIAPITLGNSHGWPYLLWVQFVTAAVHGSSSVQTFPHAESMPETIEASRQRLSSWREREWFHLGAWPRGWAAGLTPLMDGSAAFSIMNETMLTALPPQNRRNMIFVPFPGSATNDPWTVGSVHYLGVLTEASNRRTARALITYLRTADVTTRLSETTGRPFFSWDTGETPPQILDAWIDRANTPELNALARWAVE
ncbi:MAG: hypothetical protein EA383_02375 [Spirochaetaceae bacterium]|nr:MAG: hypothetical protein EA383_02375 [Spirochaetaceae bacterium]